jgi:hypothetical protein
LPALVAGAVADLARAELTITPRLIFDVIERGDPAGLDIPIGASCDLLVPIGRENAAHERDLWTRVLIQPGAGLVRVLGQQHHFVEKRLKAEAGLMLSPRDLAERCKQFDERDFWVRRSISAAMIAPNQVKRYEPAPTDEAEARELTQQEKAAAKAKAARVRASSHKSVEASKFNAEEAAAYGAKRKRELAAEAEAARPKKGARN